MATIRRINDKRIGKSGFSYCEVAFQVDTDHETDSPVDAFRARLPFGGGYGLIGDLSQIAVYERKGRRRWLIGATWRKAEN